jgi:uncharacterized protein (DUF2062 family)
MSQPTRPETLAASPPTPHGHRARVRRFLLKLRTEDSGPNRDPLAVAVGVFIGCTPLYGFHLALCLAVSKLLRLNRLKVYLAANISNPLLAPFLVFAEIQTGAWLRQGHAHELTWQALAAIDPWSYGVDLVVGSLAVGIVLSITLGLLTWSTTRRKASDPVFQTLAGRAAERFASSSLTAWEFANGKLRSDPVYRQALSGLLPSGDTLVDLGCGQGLMLAVLAEIRASRATPSRGAVEPAWPAYTNLIGVELRPRVARLAAEALAADEVRIIEQDALMTPLPPAIAVLLFDVLHLVPASEQAALLAAVKQSVQPGGVVLVREADRGAGWRFWMIAVGNRLKNWSGGRWAQPFAFRDVAGWRALFEQCGFAVQAFPGPADHPFANVLYRLTLPGDPQHADYTGRS